MPEHIVYRYREREDGGHVIGIPMRDLTDADLPSLDVFDLHTAISAGLFEKAKGTKEERTVVLPSEPDALPPDAPVATGKAEG